MKTGARLTAAALVSVIAGCALSHTREAPEPPEHEPLIADGVFPSPDALWEPTNVLYEDERPRLLVRPGASGIGADVRELANLDVVIAETPATLEAQELIGVCPVLTEGPGEDAVVVFGSGDTDVAVEVWLYSSSRNRFEPLLSLPGQNSWAHDDTACRTAPDGRNVVVMTWVVSAGATSLGPVLWLSEEWIRRTRADGPCVGPHCSAAQLDGLVSFPHLAVRALDDGSFLFAVLPQRRAEAPLRVTRCSADGWCETEDVGPEMPAGRYRYVQSGSHVLWVAAEGGAYLFADLSDDGVQVIEAGVVEEVGEDTLFPATLGTGADGAWRVELLVGRGDEDGPRVLEGELGAGLRITSARPFAGLTPNGRAAAAARYDGTVVLSLDEGTLSVFPMRP